MSFRLWSAICLCLTPLFAFPAMADEPAATSDENPLPRILRDWAKRRQDLGLVTYRYSGTRTWPQGAYNDMAAWIEKSSSTNTTADNPESDVTGIVKIKATLDFRNNRCRIESEEDDYFPLRRAPYRMRLLTVGNDGIRTTQILENNEPAVPQVDFVIAKGDAQSESILARRYNLPMMLACGVVPTKRQQIKESKFALEMNSKVFTFERYIEEQGRKLAILRVQDYLYSATSHYWVDLKRDSAIVKLTRQQGENDEIVAVLEIDYGLTDGIWLPTHWTTTHNGVSGGTRVIESMTVTKIERLANVSNDTFVLKPSPRMHVVEYEYGVDPQSQELVFQETGFVQNPDGSRDEQYTKSQNSRRQK